MKKVKKEKTSLNYLNRLTYIGLFGIGFSLVLFGFDIYNFKKNWYSYSSLVVDFLLLLFSIYFIVKAGKLKKIESKNKK